MAESQQMDLIPVAVQLCAWRSGMPCTLPGCCMALVASQRLPVYTYNCLWDLPLLQGSLVA